MALTADGRKLYVANGRSGTVTVVDVATRSPLGHITVGAAPWGVVIP
jgi:YVTN family beta-propeller protein